MGIFKKIGNALKKTKDAFNRKIDALLSHGDAASISSKNENGNGLSLKIANSNAMAVKVFSPPLNSESLFAAFPGN